jgi:hypothetical protein
MAMTTEPRSDDTTPSAPDRSATVRRLARVGVVLGLGAALAFTGACRRSSPQRAVDPRVKTWQEKVFNPAAEDMSLAARDAKDMREGCKAALGALTSHEARLIETPDEQLTQIVKDYIADRKAAYTKCAETGEFVQGNKIRQIQQRVNELNAQYEPE